MRQTFPEAAVQDYHDFDEIMTNHQKDRLVLAAAVADGAGTIVTSNLRHFPVAALAPYEVRANSPDEYVSDLLAREPDVILGVLREQAAALKNPPMSVADVLGAISQSAPNSHPSVALAIL